MAKKVTLENLQRQIRKIVADQEQIVRDLEWWNANRNDAEPFDVGGDKVVLAKARECRDAMDRGDTTAPCHEELVELMKRRATTP